MTEEQHAKAAAQSREFPETMEIMDRIRDAMAARLFQTPVNASVERENLYLRVQTLDAMKIEMRGLLADINDDRLIAAHLESIATTGK